MALLSILLAGGQSAFIPEHLWVVIAFGGIVISLAGSRIPFTVNPWICHLGKLSYSCYLTHFAALAMVIRIMGFVLRGHLLAQEAGVVKLDSGHGLVNLALFLSMTLSSLILTALFSTVTYHLVENPGIALGKSVIRRIAGRA
jgi:peptidoglycan/LPS O-acetylase OafA/YrhL